MFRFLDGGWTGFEKVTSLLSSFMGNPLHACLLQKEIDCHGDYFYLYVITPFKTGPPLREGLIGVHPTNLTFCIRL